MSISDAIAFFIMAMLVPCSAGLIMFIIVALDKWEAK